MKSEKLGLFRPLYRGYNLFILQINLMFCGSLGKALTNKKRRFFVVMLGFYMSFLNLSQLPAAKKEMQKPSITTNVWAFLFCHGFRNISTRSQPSIWALSDQRCILSNNYVLPSSFVETASLIRQPYTL